MRRRLDQLDPNLAPSMTDPYTPTEEEAQDAELRWFEEHDWMLELPEAEEEDDA